MRLKGKGADMSFLVSGDLTSNEVKASPSCLAESSSTQASRWFTSCCRTTFWCQGLHINSRNAQLVHRLLVMTERQARSCRGATSVDTMCSACAEAQCCKVPSAMCTQKVAQQGDLPQEAQHCCTATLFMVAAAEQVCCADIPGPFQLTKGLSCLQAKLPSVP